MQIKLLMRLKKIKNKYTHTLTHSQSLIQKQIYKWLTPIDFLSIKIQLIIESSTLSSLTRFRNKNQINERDFKNINQ